MVVYMLNEHLSKIKMKPLLSLELLLKRCDAAQVRKPSLVSKGKVIQAMSIQW